MDNFLLYFRQSNSVPPLPFHSFIFHYSCLPPLSFSLTPYLSLDIHPSSSLSVSLPPSLSLSLSLSFAYIYIYLVACSYLLGKHVYSAECFMFVQYTHFVVLPREFSSPPRPAILDCDVLCSVIIYVSTRSRL